MSERKKRNIIIGSLCTVLLLMVVGYAAFQSVLKIKGTSTISSNWDVRITNIEKIENKGATEAEGTPKHDELSATFNTSFTTPGDYATYKIEITNNGSLDAVLKDITMPENTNNDIIFYLNKYQNNELITGALEKNSVLNKSGETGNVGYVYVTVLYRDYENQQTAQDKTANMTITFDFEQATGNGGTIGGQTAADKLIETAVTTGDGLYKDEYEEGRYVYKGANPNNYITFNNETWRILAVETDGTLKIMKKDNIGSKKWDTSGSTNWASPATLNTYLNNDYYNTLSSETQNLIQTHTWGIGPVTLGNSDLAAQIQSENSTTWSGNIGLMSVSDFLRANTNTEQCGNHSLNNSNKDTCKTTNYIVPSSSSLWTISPRASNTRNVFYVTSDGDVYDSYADFYGSVVPALYLTSNIHLDGEGTESNPYRVVS